MPEYPLFRLLTAADRKADLVRSIVSIAFLAAAMLVLGMTVSASLFLSRAGAESIPLFYLLQAPTSLLVTSLLMRRMDRVASPRLLRHALLTGLVLIPAARGLLFWESRPVYFAVYIGVALFELVTHILVWMLTHDYFTLLDAKRHASAISLALAAGGFAGGSLAGLFARWSSAPNVLLALMPVILLLLYQLVRLERRHTPVHDAGARDNDADETGSMSELFRAALRRYPLITLIGAGLVLDVILQCVAEFQVYSIYTAQFEDEQMLMTFLAAMNVVLSVLGCVLSLWIVPRLIDRIGVRWVNLLYPLTTLVSFTGLALQFRLPAAILAHVNYDTGAEHVGTVANTLTYNALPNRYVGRVRVFNDGILYNAALAGAGLLLMILQVSWRQSQISVLCIVGSVLFVGIGFLRGRFYVYSLTRHIEDEHVPAPPPSQPTSPALSSEVFASSSLSSAERRTVRACHELLATVKPLTERAQDVSDFITVRGQRSGDERKAWKRIDSHLRRQKSGNCVDAVLAALKSGEIGSRAKAVELLTLSYSREELWPILPLLDALGGQKTSHQVLDYDGTLSELLAGIEQRASRASEIVSRTQDDEIHDRELQYIKPFWDLSLARHRLNDEEFWNDAISRQTGVTPVNSALVRLPDRESLCRVAEGTDAGDQEAIYELLWRLDDVVFNFVDVMARMKNTFLISDVNAFSITTHDGYRLVYRSLNRTTASGVEYRIVTCQYRLPDGEELKFQKDYSERPDNPHVSIHLHNASVASDDAGAALLYDGTWHELTCAGTGRLRVV